MITFTAKIKRFGEKGEKSGWFYIEISKSQAEKLNPGCKKSFRIKGKLDNLSIQKTALLPAGNGSFILPINATHRKGTGKTLGDTLKVQAELDDSKFKLSADLIECLKDDEHAYEFFKTLSPGHQRYFSNWIESAKTLETKTKRVTMAVTALAMKQGFDEMIRANKRAV